MKLYITISQSLNEVLKYVTLDKEKHQILTVVKLKLENETIYQLIIKAEVH